MSHWVTVITFALPYESYVPQSLLESAGIPVHVRGDNVIHVQNLYSQAVGGVGLQVPSDRAEEAIEMLIEGGFIKNADEIGKEALEGQRLERFSQRYRKLCPYCGSGEVMIKKQTGFGVALAYLGIPIFMHLFDRRARHCFDCDKDWKAY